MAPVLFNRQAFIILQAVAGEINLQKALQGKDLGFTLNYGSEQFTNRKETIMIMKRFALVSRDIGIGSPHAVGNAPSAPFCLRGTDDPGRAVYHTINQGIAPGQSARFDYKPSPPLPVRQDGNFDIGASVAGFEQIYR